MNVIVYYPKSSNELKDLQKKVAAVHADAVIQYIQKQPCHKEQKLEMVNKLKEPAS